MADHKVGKGPAPVGFTGQGLPRKFSDGLVRINQPVILGVGENEEIAKTFREKVLVNLFMKTR